MDIPFTFNNMTSLAWTCAQSRLWGGMHYTAAIDNSIPLIKDFGKETFNYVKDLLNGDTLDFIPVEYRHDACNYPTKKACVKKMRRGDVLHHAHGLLRGVWQARGFQKMRQPISILHFE